MTFSEMYTQIHDINKTLKGSNFQRVEVEKEFFKDLEKVFDEVAEDVSWFHIMDEDDG